ncbi:MAG: glycosyl transferase, partial [Desulfuromonas sp.]
MHRIFFERVGCFDESLPMLEDVAMADSVSAVGRWVLLPGELVTSARRFESEGLLERQTLNALIMNFRHIGWSAFFEALPDIYLLQAQTSALKLLPVWIVIRDLFAKLPLHDRRRLWCATGGYVRSQAWQLVFFWHCRRQFHRGQVATMGPHELSETMRGFERLTNNPFGRSLAALLVW